MRDYQESATTRQTHTDGQTDAGQSDPYVPLCSEATQKWGILRFALPLLVKPYVVLLFCRALSYISLIDIALRYISLFRKCKTAQFQEFERLRRSNVEQHIVTYDTKWRVFCRRSILYPSFLRLPEWAFHSTNTCFYCEWRENDKGQRLRCRVVDGWKRRKLKLFCFTAPYLY